MDFSTGGRGAIERMVEAYGFTTRQALCEQLGISKSSLATRYMRDSFPSDWVIQCSLETGISLQWLVNGTGPLKYDTTYDIAQLPHYKILDGALLNASFYYLDRSLIPDNIVTPILISSEDDLILSDFEVNELIDGKWLIEIEGKIGIRDIMLIPKGRVKVSNAQSSFECLIDDINIRAKCMYKLFAKL
ncbi:phage repressor protein CI [Pluralibacter gergoviae]|uniref:phage repressor protein CI n=1 Tax=Pluralibacter gergoviae TaxID=61647 RepID=UPI00155F4DF3|nr:phage repressor protein CI [Pluralibacter gergoviae]MDU4002706.1 phage repressor protein CI [Pluralibacter gergoviae]